MAGVTTWVTAGMQERQGDKGTRCDFGEMGGPDRYDCHIIGPGGLGECGSRSGLESPPSQATIDSD